MFLCGLINVRKSIDDDPKSGRSLTSISNGNIAKSRNLVRYDRRLTIRKMGNKLNLRGSVNFN